MIANLYGAAYKDQVTIHHLLGHRSGLVNTGIPSTLSELAGAIDAFGNLGHIFTVDDVIKSAYGKPLLSPPGMGFHYSNLGYQLLGRIAEAVEGKPYGEIVGEKIAAHLGLTHTGLSRPTDARPIGLARGYEAFFNDNTFYDVTEYYNTDDCAAGGIISNTYEVSEFYRALFSAALFSAAQLGKMTARDSIEDVSAQPFYDVAYYGLGLSELVKDGVSAFYHNGWVSGYYAIASYFPATDTSAVMFFNCTPGSTAIAPHFALTNETLWKIGTGGF